MPEPVRTLAYAYAAAGGVIVAASFAAATRLRRRGGAPAPWLSGAPA